MNRQTSAKTAALGLLVIAAGAVLGGSMMACANDEATAISACYSTRNGALRIVAADETTGFDS